MSKTQLVTLSAVTPHSSRTFLTCFAIVAPLPSLIDGDASSFESFSPKDRNGGVYINKEIEMKCGVNGKLYFNEILY